MILVAVMNDDEVGLHPGMASSEDAAAMEEWVDTVNVVAHEQGMMMVGNPTLKMWEHHMVDTYHNPLQLLRVDHMNLDLLQGVGESKVGVHDVDDGVVASGAFALDEA